MKRLTPDLTAAQLFVVQASAGSGKTYALATRYIRLLVESDLPRLPLALRSVLAITFTNKAAVQMKERILLFLKQIAFDQFRDPAEKIDILSSFSLDEKTLRARSRAILDAIIREYNYFQVQTIDSFINAILSGCSFRLDLSARFKIKDQFRQYLASSLDQLIERAHSQKAVMSMLEDYVRQFLFLEHRKGWFPKQDLQEMLCRLFDDSNIYGAPFGSFALPKNVDLYQLRKRIFSLIKTLLDQEPEGANQLNWKALKNKYEHAASRYAVEDIAESFIKEAVPLKKGFEADPGTEKLWSTIRDLIGELFEFEAQSLFNCYVAVFAQVYEGLVEAARKDDVVFLNELNRKAHVLLDEKHVTVPELYYRLASRFEHFLIDEFQDTSRLQWHNLYPMVEEALAKGGTLFYVGDKKQAIFRFRGGDVTLFDGIPQAFSRFPVRLQCLRHNYRSGERIIEFNNAVFSPDNLRRYLTGESFPAAGASAVGLSARDVDDIISVFDGCSQDIGRQATQGLVRVSRIDNASQEDSLGQIQEQLLEVIAQVMRRSGDAGCIAILCRSNQQIELVSSWLLARGIPVESEKTLNIREHPLIKELMSFLRFLDSPIDNLSFASFVLGDIFCSATGLSQQDVHDFIFSVHVASSGQASSGYLYRHFRQRFPGVWEQFIEPFFNNVGSMPLYELVVSICARFQVAERFMRSQGFLMRFLEVVKSQVDEELASLALFLEFFDQAPDDTLYVNAAQTQAVKVLSIHKAKGLEFPVVILPFFEIKPDIGSGRERDPYVLYPDQESLRLLKVNKTYAAFSGLLRDIYTAEYKMSLIDELNAAYVALTRARQELYVFIPKKSSNRLNSATALIPEDRCAVAQQPDPLVVSQRRSAQICLEASKFRDWISVLRPETIDERTLVRRDEIKRGIWLHGALSFVGGLKPDDMAAAVSGAVRMAQRRFGGRDDAQSLQAMIERIVRHEQLRPYFFPGPGEQVYREIEIVDEQARTFRIDRLWVAGGRAVVIDYKSSHQGGAEARAQILAYLRLVGKLFADKKTSAILVYMDTAEIECFDA